MRVEMGVPPANPDEKPPCRSKRKRGRRNMSPIVCLPRLAIRLGGHISPSPFSLPGSPIPRFFSPCPSGSAALPPATPLSPHVPPVSISKPRRKEPVPLPTTQATESLTASKPEHPASSKYEPSEPPPKWKRSARPHSHSADPPQSSLE